MYEKNAYAASFFFGSAAALTAPAQPPKEANGAWLTPSLALGQVVASHFTSSPVSQFSTSVEPGVITAPTLSFTVEVSGSIASVPISPQSIVRAQRPEVNRPRVSPTPRLSSSGGPYWVVSLYTSRARLNAALLNKGCISVVLKKAPCAVPWLWMKGAATEVIHQ